MSTQTPFGRLAGKTAVITGGTTGIGLETARHFLKEGARVLITGRSQERVDAALKTLGDGSAGAAEGFVADGADLSALDALADAARDRFGALDIVFANAGGGSFAPIGEVDDAHFDSQFDVNVKGVFFTVQKLLPVLRDGASIVLNASAIHAKGAPGASVYSATKAALRSFARSFATELGARGVRVNTLSPGVIPTKFFANSNLGDAAFAQFEDIAGKTAPLGRAGRPEEIAQAAVFLASDESSYMNAADLTVDGGWSQV
ncbi:MAG: SDR family oxidoreductase [Pseudomonadota bacterium]